MSESSVEQADRIGRKRARFLPVIGIIFLTQQMAFVFQTEGERAVDHVRLFGWLLMGLVIVAALATGGYWLKSKEMRELLDDEVSRANRKEAMSLGFILSMLSGLALFPLRSFIEIDGGLALHLVVSIGLFAAIVRFGLLERRAYRDG